MFRCVIRDVLWLMAVVAFAIFWFLERDGRITDTERIGMLYRENETLKKEVRRFESQRLRDMINARQTIHELHLEASRLRENGE